MSFQISPIGGVGQIGSNMLWVENNGEGIVIDCGILFPYEDAFGINYLIPNFYHLPRPSSIIITHGHEDHIGALAHLVEHFPGLQIYAPPFAAVLIKKKFDYFPRKLDYKLDENIKQTINQISLQFDYIQVNHSIPDTYGIHIKNPKTKSSLFYVSDFKVDKKAILEPYFDFEKLKKVSSSATSKLLMADSTNILSSLKRTTSESDLVPTFKSIFSRSEKRIFITTFSSNIHRIINIYQQATASGRKCVLYGRSLNKYFESAIDAKVIEKPDEFKLHDADHINSDEPQVIVVSGCQGDFRSTFRRICYSHDSRFTPTSKDLFIMSSKPIPGNEKMIGLCLNELSLLGAEVITAADALVHASGHPGRDDLKDLLNHYRPTHFIPIHGESLFLERHKDWINKGFSSIDVFKLKNQDIFNLDELKKTEFIDHKQERDPILIHGNAHYMSRDSVKEKRKLAESGLLVVTVSQNKSKILETSISYQGISFTENINEDKANKLIKKEIQKEFSKTKDYSESLRISARLVIHNLFGIKPVTIVNIHHV